MPVAIDDAPGFIKSVAFFVCPQQKNAFHHLVKMDGQQTSISEGKNQESARFHPDRSNHLLSVHFDKVMERVFLLGADKESDAFYEARRNSIDWFFYPGLIWKTRSITLSKWTDNRLR